MINKEDISCIYCVLFVSHKENKIHLLFTLPVLIALLLYYPALLSIEMFVIVDRIKTLYPIMVNQYMNVLKYIKQRFWEILILVICNILLSHFLDLQYVTWWFVISDLRNSILSEVSPK